jgi:hypothetical protein
VVIWLGTSVRDTTHVLFTTGSQCCSRLSGSAHHCKSGSSRSRQRHLWHSPRSTHHRHRQGRRPQSRRCDDDDRDNGDDKYDGGGGGGGGKSGGGGSSSSWSADTRLTWSAVLLAPMPGHQCSVSSRPPRQRHLEWSATLSTSVQICTKTLLVRDDARVRCSAAAGPTTARAKVQPHSHKHC